jgi:hypothetical protein
VSVDAIALVKSTCLQHATCELWVRSTAWSTAEQLEMAAPYRRCSRRAAAYARHQTGADTQFYSSSYQECMKQLRGCCTGGLRILLHRSLQIA